MPPRTRKAKIETVELPEPTSDLCCGNGCCEPPVIEEELVPITWTTLTVDKAEEKFPNSWRKDAITIDIKDIHCDCMHAGDALDGETTEQLEELLTAVLEELDSRDELGVRFVGRDADIIANVVIKSAQEVIDLKKSEPKKSILDEAAEIVSGARRKAYGHPENNFGRISALWNAYLSGKPSGALPITNTDVSLLMILMKVARLIESPDHRDSLVDLAGYAATVEMLWDKP